MRQTYLTAFISHGIGLDCKKTCAYSFPCFPMDVPQNDSRIKNRKCMDFIRSSSICGSDTTSVFFDKLQSREQINQLTAFIDGSQVCNSHGALSTENKFYSFVCFRYMDLRTIGHLYFEKSKQDTA